jgi:hypothetical protein
MPARDCIARDRIQRGYTTRLACSREAPVEFCIYKSHCWQKRAPPSAARPDIALLYNAKRIYSCTALRWSPPSPEDRSSRETQSSREGDGPGLRPGNGRWLVGTGFCKVFPHARGCPRQTAERRLPSSVFPCACTYPRRVSDRVGRWIPPLRLPAIRLPTRGEQAGRARGRDGALEGLRLEGATPASEGKHPARTKSAALAVRTVSRTGRDKRGKPQQINNRAEENRWRQGRPNRTLGPMNPTGDEPTNGGVD